MEFPQEGPFQLAFKPEDDAVLVSFGVAVEQADGVSIFVSETHAIVRGVRYFQYWADHDTWLYEELYFAGPLQGEALVRLQTEAATTSGQDSDRLASLHGFAIEGMGMLVELLHAGDVGLLPRLPESPPERPSTDTWEVVTEHPLTVLQKGFPAGTRIRLNPDISRGSVHLQFTPGETAASSGPSRTLHLGHITELWALAEHSEPPRLDEPSIQLMPALDEFAPTRGVPPGLTRTRGPFAGRRLDDALSADRRPSHRTILALGSLRAQVLHAEAAVWVS